MRITRGEKNSAPSRTTTPNRRNSLLRSEWPLLVYPVLVVAALGILYGVSQSIQRELTPSPAGRVGTPAEAPSVRSLEGETVTPPADAAVGDVAVVQEHNPTTLLGEDHASTFTPDTAETDAQPAATDLESLEGTDRVLAMLRQALQTGDNAQVKQCMDDLVALGDDVVGPLSEIVASRNDATALWAAKALARIGTPTASGVLLDTLTQTGDGPYKEQLAKEISSIDNHDSWPVLLDALQDTADAAVMRAAGTSLARMADKPIVDEIVARYDAAATEEQADRLARMIGNISSPAASESLLALAGDVSATPQDGLEKAAVEALANVADAQCVSYLLRKLEASAPGEDAYLFNAVASISQPQAEAALRYAASGSKEVSAEHGRTAAIYALGNFPNEQTYALLEQIVATEDNASVLSAAARTLETIRNTEPIVAANVAAQGHEDFLLPTNPMQK
ncbi:MAG: HEAT repeat domain-containing protein [Sedimentisphaerales bacterium]|nr:HEAT repeat domain-containing protein [Sedimentisphaerales bacterium]